MGVKIVNDQSTSENTLVDGSAPIQAAELEGKLDSWGIAYSTISHPPMRTVEDSKKFRDGVPGGYSKNLFLRNKKGRMWLVTLHEDRQIDLKALGELIGAGRVSFASPERLMQYLGVIPGAVTPLAVINDLSKSVQFVLDEHLLELAPLHFHPCDNSKTTTLEASGLMEFLRQTDHPPLLVDFDSLTINRNAGQQ